MSSETFSYKGISAGRYVEGNIEAVNQDEASFKLKAKKIIITNFAGVFLNPIINLLEDLVAQYCHQRLQNFLK